MLKCESSSMQYVRCRLSLVFSSFFCLEFARSDYNITWIHVLVLFVLIPSKLTYTNLILYTEIELLMEKASRKQETRSALIQGRLVEKRALVRPKDGQKQEKIVPMLN